MTQPRSHRSHFAKHNLPSEKTSFVGRHDVTELAKSRLSPRLTRLLTITGAGGVGKTRLALRIAAELLDFFTDGVVFVALAPLDDPSLVIPSIAQAFGLPRAQGVADLEDHLRAKDVLLVLDNFEHLVCAAQSIGDLLDRCAGLSVLATSREILRLAREHILELPPMQTPDAALASDLSALGRVEAVMLFNERAQSIQADFALTSANAAAVAAICRRLDGLPLAIELAAARVRMFDPTTMLGQLSSRFSFLTGGPTDGSDRHRGLRSAIDWSYDLLSRPEQCLFERLSVFAGGFALDAIEAVAGTPDQIGINSLDGIAGLVDKSLVRQLQPASSSARYAMLETIREYALERLLASGDESRTRGRHARYFRLFTEQSASELRRGEQIGALARLEREHDNLRAALAYAVVHETSADALQFGAGLSGFWKWHGYLSEGRESLGQLLDLPMSSGESIQARASVLNAAGDLAWLQGDYVLARSLVNDSLSTRRELGDALGVALSLSSLGEIARLQGDYASAQSLFGESLAIGRQLHDTVVLGSILNSLGNVARLQTDYMTARIYLEEGLACTRGVGDRVGETFALARLAEIARAEGRFASAQSLARLSLESARELGDKLGIATSLTCLGAIARQQRDYAAASVFLAESLAIRRETGNRRGTATSLLSLAEVTLALGQHRLARTYLVESLMIARELHNRHYVAAALEVLAAVGAAEGQVEDSMRLAGAAAGLRQVSGAPLSPADTQQLQRWLDPSRRHRAPQANADAWTEGQSMSEEEMVAFALECCDPDLRPRRGPGRSTDPARGTALLTVRERQVATLVASGRSNRDIAEALVVAVSTVERHVANIFNKLGLRTRTELAVVLLRNDVEPVVYPSSAPARVQL